MLLTKRKLLYVKPRMNFMKPWKSYDKAFESTCSHKEEFHILWEDNMCCPKIWFECNGNSGSEADRECDGGKPNWTSDDSA